MAELVERDEDEGLQVGGTDSVPDDSRRARELLDVVYRRESARRGQAGVRRGGEQPYARNRRARSGPPSWRERPRSMRLREMKGD